jgi:hypothetical protein
VSTTTVEQAIATHGVQIDEHLDRQVDIPIVSFARQGDVIVIPDPGGRAASGVVPAAGIPVVRGENGGHTHLLLTQGDVRFDAVVPSETDLTLGSLTVSVGAVAFLAHPEHGYVGVLPGQYTVRRQREQADEIRLVQD